MAFLLANWGRSSVTANEPIVTLTGGVIVGSPRTYEYYTADTQATVAAANYFAPTQALNICNDVSVGDTISVYSSADLTKVAYIVTAVASSPAAISIAPSSGMLQANVTVTNTQMLAGIYGTPIQIIPAPGANRVILIVNATISIIYGAVQYQNGGATLLQYDNTVHGAGTNACTQTLAAASINAATANNFISLVGAAQAWGLNTALGNKGIFISCATGEFTNGDSPLKVSVSYRVASLT